MEYIDWKVSGIMNLRNSFGYRVTLTLPDGTEKVQQKSGFATAKDAQQGRDLAVAQLYSNSYVTEKGITVRDYFTNWLENVIRCRCKVSTYSSYYYTLKNHIYPNIGGVKLAELTKAHILYLYRLVGEKYESLVKQCRVILKTGLRLAKMNHLISVDPAKDVLIPRDIYEATPYHKMNINPAKTLTVEQLNLLIENSRDTKIYLFVLFAGLMGLRKSEIIGLKYSDVNFAYRTLHVRRQLGRDLSKENIKPKTKTKQEIELKSRSSNRVLNIPDIVFEAIMDERQRYEANRRRRAKQFQDLDYICCSTYGRPRSASFCYTAVLTIDHDKFVMLKTLNLIPRNSTIADLKSILPSNFLELYICQEGGVYQFLGTNFYFECVYRAETNIFVVGNVKKIIPIEREIMKKKFCEISAKLDFPNPNYIHRLSKNDNLEIKNLVDAFCEEFRSKNNVDAEYKRNYGPWRELLTLMKKSVEDSVQRFQYDSYSIEGNVCSFNLCAGVFLGDTVYTKETKFVFEKKKKGKNKNQLIYIGNYDEDCLVEDHVVLKVRFLRKPDRLPQKGIICLDYSENLINIERQLDALDNIERDNYSCQYNLKEIFAGVTQPRTSLLHGKIKFFNPKLDLPQKTAVEKALNSESLTIIQGPPGTGKTNVIIEIIRQILKMNTDYPDLPEKKILLVSQSHPAVDKMLDDLIQQSKDKPNLIRVGRDEKLNDEIREEFGLNYVKDNWVAQVRVNCTELAESYCKELGVSYSEFEEYYREYEKQFIANIDRDTIDQQLIDGFVDKTSTPSKEKIRKILEIQKQWGERLPQCEEVDLYIIKSTTIIAGTCTGFISNRVIRGAEFDYVIVDEAAKATYPELAVSFAKAEKIILVGDHKQLPPVLDTEIIEANKDTIHAEDLAEGLFEKLYNNFPEANKHRLTIQYRMHPVIGSLISKVFYENEIQNGTPKEQRNTGISCYDDVAIEWITTSYLSPSRRYEKRVGNAANATYKNNAELDIIKNKLRELDSLATRTIKVGVITAYRAQKSAIKDMVKQQNFEYLQVEVDTVDAFQGGQKEIIIYSTVRSSDNPKRIGFLRSEARLNVSLSRAQSLLIIVGDLTFLNNPQIQGNKFPEIIEYIGQTEGCKITVAEDQQ